MAREVVGRAYARAGFIGNPSDGYFGRTISVICKNFGASATLVESEKLTIVPQVVDRLEFASIDALVSDISTYGYYGGVRLIKAAMKVLHAYCAKRGIVLPKRNFTLSYQTDVPVRVGLAGSSAIVTAIMKGLLAFYEIDVPREMLPSLILSVELDELGIGAGLQDRVIQVYEGAVYMNFDQAYMKEHGHGKYEPLDPKLLPPIYIAYHSNLAEGTEVTHNNLRQRYNAGDPEVLAGIKRWTELTDEAVGLIRAGRGHEVGPLVNANFDQRAALINISPGNWKLINTGRELGAYTHFAGSGGAILGVYDGDPARLEKLKAAYAAFGASLIIPQVV
jgi:glucuronokinase